MNDFRGVALINGVSNIYNKENTFTAFIWSPLNKGRATVRISCGTTVRELLQELSSKKSWECSPEIEVSGKGDIAGWCVLCQSEDGSYRSLDYDCEVPSRPLKKSDRRMGWAQTLYKEFRSTDPHFDREQSSFETFQTRDPGRHKRLLEDFKRLRKEMPSFWYYIDRGPVDPLASKFSPPKPESDVDVTLVVVIGVTGG